MENAKKSEEINLYMDNINCCACGACLNACPKNAISMKEDQYGYLYPVINQDKCIQCGKCIRVCNYQSGGGERTKITYVGMAKDEFILNKSSSGGIFAAIATEVLNKGGTVFGCSFEVYEDGLHPEHIRIEKLTDLHKLQGSKYVQSSIGNSYRKVKEDLIYGRLVLFSGTPCQVDALRGFLGNKTYSNLLTIDIICHGVPSSKMFNDYIHEFEKRLKGRIVRFSFRDKKEGWGLNGSIEYLDRSGKLRKKNLPIILSSYYKLFLTSEIYRESCYSCKYAGLQRPGDITIGDFWGIESEHPEVLLKNGGPMDIKKGISCILVNTEQGNRMVHELGVSLVTVPSSFEKAARQNGQLNMPSKCSEKRAMILGLYEKSGYSAIDRWYYHSLGWKRYAYEVRHALPQLFERKS